MWCCDDLQIRTCDLGETCECVWVDDHKEYGGGYWRECSRPYVLMTLKNKGAFIVDIETDKTVHICPFCGECITDLLNINRQYKENVE